MGRRTFGKGPALTFAAATERAPTITDSEAKKRGSLIPALSQDGLAECTPVAMLQGKGNMTDKIGQVYRVQSP